MYNFDKQAEKIIQEARKYGITIDIINNGHSPKDAVMQFIGYFHGSTSVERALERKMKTWNEHIKRGF